MIRALQRASGTNRTSGLRGDASGLTGDLDACQLTWADRSRGVAIKDLVSPAPGTY